MNTTLRNLIAVGTLGLSFYACADSASINYRHSFTEDDSIHSDRIKLSYRMDSGLGFAAEVKYKTAGDREDVAYDNVVNNGHEFTVDYNYKLSAKSTLQPLFIMDSVKDATTYKFGLKYTYKIDDAWYVATRIRHDARRLDRDVIDRSKDDRAKDNQNTTRFEGWLGWTPSGPWAFEYQYIYFDTDYIRYDNKKSDYEQNMVVKYKINKQWQPFMEVGDIKVNSTTDDRQARWRVGIQYNFL
ncbi:oligogalacturonate-specific porin KdgM family protein [Pseudomonas sp. 21LCFQ010]|uniref:oligogalacturonate-specific porin KdgM family protein n=1 Tax=Pseudomonas sp. 21LCFQ010 TaxID=2957506 RepID=UPI002097B82D|nr:oligogalacturonate-specific porin KdgM family protein [Pseudomonas sp. 21LCFQ010]MCO8163140.1 oligogalacturonate-specific porin KdgM family protein [Pseudomonas sp. 21LCFQ010]